MCRAARPAVDTHQSPGAAAPLVKVVAIVGASALGLSAQSPTASLAAVAHLRRVA
jgi:hypothetical protein